MKQAHARRTVKEPANTRVEMDDCQERTGTAPSSMRQRQSRSGFVVMIGPMETLCWVCFC